MQTVAIISDTHIPSRARTLPVWVSDEIESADLVIHAGDFDSEAAYETIDDFAQRLVAVAGNTDPPLGLPEVTTVDVEEATFVVTHGSGSLAGYWDRILETIKSADASAIGVSGHTHELADRTVDGVRLVNPGSATGALPAQEETMLRAEVDGASVTMTSLTGG